MNRKYLLGCGVAAAVASLAAPAAAQERTFDIPAQAVDQAISAFGRQSGLQHVAPGVEDEVRSQPVKGRMDARAALRRLIAGTGLEIASDSGDLIVLRRAPAPADPARATTLQDVIVTAQKRDEAAQNVPIALTAFSASTVAVCFECSLITTASTRLRRKKVPSRRKLPKKRIAARDCE